MKTHLLLLFLQSLFCCSLTFSQETAKTSALIKSHQVTAEGAWCWFADPRALHYENKEGNINKTYIGYIDVHGNIKAMQYDFNKNTQQEVLIRSYFQPDDHNNPTFLVLPDERIMIFYSRHTDERCFYYRISQKAGDITTLGKEYRLETEHATTYPSPFILSNDPEHIYLCWRGVEWHPTIGRLTLPDAEGHCEFDWNPKQIVRYSTDGVRPYAKYSSNGKDKIYMTYTTTHPDNENPNWVYFNYIQIPSSKQTSEITLTDVNGKVLSKIDEQTHIIQKSADYLSAHTDAVVDHPESYRDWVWEVAKDNQGNPVIAMVRISADKTLHSYYYAQWTGKEWSKTLLSPAGGHFHQSPTIEKCYSAGMAIDKENPGVVYCSIPIEGEYGKVYEIMKYTLENRQVVSVEAVTRNSQLNNVRPYMIPGSRNTPLRLTWMYGNYYDWIVSGQRQQGYCTEIHADFPGFVSATDSNKQETDLNVIKKYKFDSAKEFDFAVTLPLDTANYQGRLLQLGKLGYYLNGKTMKPEIRYKDKVYPSTNVLGTSDSWRHVERSSNGKWYAPQKYPNVVLRLAYKEGILRTYINGLLDQTIELL